MANKTLTNSHFFLYKNMNLFIEVDYLLMAKIFIILIKAKAFRRQDADD